MGTPKILVVIKGKIGDFYRSLQKKAYQTGNICEPGGCFGGNYLEPVMVPESNMIKLKPAEIVAKCASTFLRVYEPQELQNVEPLQVDENAIVFITDPKIAKSIAKRVESLDSYKNLEVSNSESSKYTKEVPKTNWNDFSKYNLLDGG